MADLSEHPQSFRQQMADDFAARGWPLDDLKAFRMDAEAAPSVNDVLDRLEQTIPAEPAAPADPAATPPAPAADPADDPTRDSFDRAYVEKLREENARYRTERNQVRDELGRFTSAFDGLDDDTRETLLSIPRYLTGGDKERAELGQWMRQQAEMLTAAEQAEVAEEIADAQVTDGRLSPQQVEQIVNSKLAERDQAQAVEHQLSDLRRQVEGKGFEWDSPEATSLLQLAASHTNGDLDKAHELMATWAQKAIDDYVGSRAADAGTARPTPATGQSAGPAEAKIGNLRDARSGLEAMLDARWNQ